MGHFSWGKNSTPGGAAKFSTLLLVPKTGGDLGELLQFDPWRVGVRSDQDIIQVQVINVA